MADQKQDSGPYSLYGRRTEHEQEVRVATTGSLDHATHEADDMVDTGVWYQATVRDQHDRTVHVGLVTGERDQKPDVIYPQDGA